MMAREELDAGTGVNDDYVKAHLSTRIKHGPWISLERL